MYSIQYNSNTIKSPHYFYTLNYEKKPSRFDLGSHLNNGFCNKMYGQTSSFRGYVTDRTSGTNLVGLNYFPYFLTPKYTTETYLPSQNYTLQQYYLLFFIVSGLQLFTKISPRSKDFKQHYLFYYGQVG